MGRKRDGRCIYDPQARSELVRASRQPGASLARIARLCGMNANVLSNWVRQSERGKAGAVGATANVVELPAASAFVAVEVGSTAPPTPAPRLELALRARLPNGVTLDMQMPDLDAADRLIEVLGRLRCSASTKP